MSKNNYSTSEQLREDLMETYHRVAPYMMRQDDAWHRVVTSPAPRYYVSPKQAYQKLAPMFRGDYSQLSGMTKLRQKMYHSLFNEVIRMSEKREFIGKRLWYIIQFAVTQPAPEFFLTTEAMRKIFRLNKRGGYDENGRMITAESHRRAYAKLKERRRKEKEGLC